MYLWFFLCLILLLFLPIFILLKSSKLSNFENFSFSFRLQYAIYTSPFGQLIHNYFLQQYKKKSNTCHTKINNKLDNYNTFSISLIPFLEDNYSYFIIDHETGNTAVVDPADPITILEAFQELSNHFFHNKKLILTTILCTHKHMDHAGGNSFLKKQIPNLQIISGIHEKVASQTIFLSNKDIFNLGLTSIQLLDTPCHTIGHVAFYISSSSSSSSSSPSHPTHSNNNNNNNCNVLFSGDTLFLGGCGRFFEGNGEIMLSTLKVIKSLPLSTKIYCGHEYSLHNLSFCLLVEPENEILLNKYNWVVKQRQELLTTIPSTLEEELEYNVFLRYDKSDVIKQVQNMIHDNENKVNEKKNTSNENEKIKFKRDIYPEMNAIKILEELRKWRNQEM